MKVCGIELKGSEAVLVCLEGESVSAFQILKNTRKIALKESTDQKEVHIFKDKILTFLEENAFDKVGIKGRATKGRFAGGSVSFKMEGLIQLAKIRVDIIHAATIKAKLKSKSVIIENENVLGYQKEALLLAKYLI